MDDDFYDWLDKCPVQWFRGKDDTETVEYTFHKPEKDEEKNSTSGWGRNFKKPQAASNKQQAWQWFWDIVGWDFNP